LAETLLAQIPQVFRLEQNDFIYFSTVLALVLFLLGDADDIKGSRQAARLMYEAQERGRNGFRFYRQNMQVQVAERAALEKALPVAVRTMEFTFSLINTK